MCCLILCQRTMNFILLLVPLSDWLLKWKGVKKPTYIVWQKHDVSVGEITHFTEKYSTCQVLTSSAKVCPWLLKVAGTFMNTEIFYCLLSYSAYN